MSKGMTCSHVTRRETGELRASHGKIPEEGWELLQDCKGLQMLS